MFLIMGLSLLPDLDVTAAILFKDMQKYHNNASHSLLFGIPVALLMAAILRQIHHANDWLWFLICLVSYDLHVVMDALTAERGVMLFWPLRPSRFASPVKIFYGLQWGLGWLSLWHLWTLLTESVFVLGLIALVNYFEKRISAPNTVFPDRARS